MDWNKALMNMAIVVLAIVVYDKFVKQYIA